MLGMSSEEISTLLIGASIAITAIWGGMKGKERLTQQGNPTPQESMVEVKGAIVSDRKVNEWIGAAEDLAGALKHSTAALNRNSDVSQNMQRRIEEAVEAITELHQEMVIAARVASRLDHTTPPQRR